MGCGNFTYEDTCGKTVYSSCVRFEDTNSVIPAISSLTTGSCNTVDEVIEDMYELINANYIDMSAYNKDCLDYSPIADADLTPMDVLNKLTEETCLLKTLTTDYANVTADVSNINFACFGSNSICGSPLSITTLEELLQEMVDRICTLEAA